MLNFLIVTTKPLKMTTLLSIIAWYKVTTLGCFLNHKCQSTYEENIIFYSIRFGAAVAR